MVFEKSRAQFPVLKIEEFLEAIMGEPSSFQGVPMAHRVTETGDKETPSLFMLLELLR